MKRILFLTVSALLVLTVSLAASAEWYIAGDVNGDGEIKANDARALLRCCAGLDDGFYLNLGYADVTRDGEIRANDARAILRAAADTGEFSAADSDIELNEEEAALAARVTVWDEGEEPAPDALTFSAGAFVETTENEDGTEYEYVIACVSFYNPGSGDNFLIPCSVAIDITDEHGENVYSSAESFGRYALCQAENVPFRGLTNIKTNGWDKGYASSPSLYISIKRDLIPSDGTKFNVSVTVENGDYFRFCSEKNEIMFHCVNCQFVVEEETEGFCGNRGHKILYCPVCGNYKTEYSDAPGEHDLQLLDDVPATCIAEGYARYICRICGESVYDEKPAPGCHDYGDGGICERCGWRYIPVTEAERYVLGNIEPMCLFWAERGKYGSETTDNSILNFSFSIRNFNESIHDDDADFYRLPCGIMFKIQDSQGNDVYSDNLVVQAKDYRDGKNGKPVFVFEKEVQPYDIYSVVYTIYFPNGRYFSYVFGAVTPICEEHDYKVAGTASPTCASAGYTEYTCKNCGYSYREIINKLPHDCGADGLCRVCGLYNVPVKDDEKEFLEETALSCEVSVSDTMFEEMTEGRHFIYVSVKFYPTDGYVPEDPGYFNDIDSVAVPFGLRIDAENQFGETVYSDHTVVTADKFTPTFKGDPEYLLRIEVPGNAAYHVTYTVYDNYSVFTEDSATLSISD